MTVFEQFAAKPDRATMGSLPEERPKNGDPTADDAPMVIPSLVAATCQPGALSSICRS